MSADWATLVVAVLGVAGTLSSPWLGQRSAARAKEQEFNLQKQQRQEERDAERQKSEFEERRSIYAKLNTSARHYQQALEACARAIREGAVTDEARAELASTRQGFRDVYSDAQMILPDEVLACAMSVSASLGKAYGMIMRLDAGQPQTGPDGNPVETPETARHYAYATVYNQILELRQLMRQDLGVAD